MALSEAEELELLELEAEAGGQGQAQTPLESSPKKPQSFLDKLKGGAAQAMRSMNGSPGSLLSPTGLAQTAQEAVQRSFNAVGEKTAEGLAGEGLSTQPGTFHSGPGIRTSPEVAAGIGTAIQMAPDIAATFAGGAPAAKATGEAITESLMSGPRLIKNLITKPGAAEVTQAGKEALIETASRGAEKLNLARDVREAAKKGLISAEEQAGLHFQSTPGFEELLKNTKKMSEFSQKIGRLAKKTPEELAQSIPSEQLQLFRKVAQEGEKVSGLSDIAKSQLRQGKDIFTRALGQSEKPVGEALGAFREADKVVSEIPGEIKSRLSSQKAQNSRAIFEAKALDKKRKVIKGLAGAAAGYLGLKSLIK